MQLAKRGQIRCGICAGRVPGQFGEPVRDAESFADTERAAEPAMRRVSTDAGADPLQDGLQFPMGHFPNGSSKWLSMAA